MIFHTAEVWNCSDAWEYLTTGHIRCWFSAGDLSCVQVPLRLNSHYICGLRLVGPFVADRQTYATVCPCRTYVARSKRGSPCNGVTGFPPLCSQPWGPRKDFRAVCTLRVCSHVRQPGLKISDKIARGKNAPFCVFFPCARAKICTVFAMVFSSD